MQVVLLDDVDFVVGGDLSDPENYDAIVRRTRQKQASAAAPPLKSLWAFVGSLATAARWACSLKTGVRFPFQHAPDCCAAGGGAAGI